MKILVKIIIAVLLLIIPLKLGHYYSHPKQVEINDIIVNLREQTIEVNHHPRSFTELERSGLTDTQYRPYKEAIQYFQQKWESEQTWLRNVMPILLFFGVLSTIQFVLPHAAWWLDKGLYHRSAQFQTKRYMLLAAGNYLIYLMTISIYVYFVLISFEQYEVK